MTARLLPRARRELRAYLYHVAADDPQAANREGVRILDALEQYAEVPIDGTEVTIPGWPRPVRRHFVRPFHVYYERRPDALYVIRLLHHARRPIER